MRLEEDEDKDLRGGAIDAWTTVEKKPGKRAGAVDCRRSQGRLKYDSTESFAIQRARALSPKRFFQAPNPRAEHSRTPQTAVTNDFRPA